MPNANVTVHLLPEEFSRDFWMIAREDTERTDFAKKIFAERKYTIPASWTVSCNGVDAAEEAFDLTNNPSRQEEREFLYGKVRSISVGDIIEVSQRSEKTQYYLCDSFGWTQI